MSDPQNPQTPEPPASEPAAPTPAPAPVPIEAWLREGFKLFQSQPGLLIAAGAITVALSVITLGVLSGPLMAGLYMLVLRLHDKASPTPKPGDLFQGFQVFLPAFLLVVGVAAITFVGSFILDFVPIVGSLAAMLGSVVLSAVVMFAMPLIADRRMQVWPAVEMSLDTIKPNFWMFLAFNLLAGVISSAGIIVCCVGIVVTLPIGVCILSVAYRDVFGQPAAGEAAPAAGA